MVFVAPLVGAWIEIIMVAMVDLEEHLVAPLVGAWIEIPLTLFSVLYDYVAPLVGAWIEIFNTQVIIRGVWCRSPCGSVD